MKKGIILLLISVLLQGGVLAVFAQPDKSPGQGEEKPQQDPYKTRIFHTDDIPELKVFTISGDIEVVHNPDIDHVRVDLYVKRPYSIWGGSVDMDNYRIIMMQRGSQIHATVERKREERGRFSRAGAEFTFLIETPKNIESNLRTLQGKITIDGITGSQILQTNSGDIISRYIEGTIQANTSSGRINISSAQGQINSRSISGDILIDRSSGEIRIRTVSGAIRGQSVEGTFVCASTSGNITGVFIDISHGIHAETVSGNVNLTLPEKSGFDLDIRGMRIDIDPFQPLDGTIRASSARGTVGDGSIPIQAYTTSGSVVLRKKPPVY